MTIHEHDWGSLIKITVKEKLEGAELPTAMDIRDATTKEFIFLKKNKVVMVKNADFVTDGSDGKLQWVVEQGTITPSGAWRVQVHLLFPNSEYRSSIIDLKIEPNIEVV